MLDDIAVTGGKVISRDLGARWSARLEDLGSARQVRISSSKTLITASGKPKEIQARREQVSRR
jgi:chaperonin GroEL